MFPRCFHGIRHFFDWLQGAVNKGGYHANQGFPIGTPSPGTHGIPVLLALKACQNLTSLLSNVMVQPGISRAVRARVETAEWTLTANRLAPLVSVAVSADWDCGPRAVDAPRQRHHAQHHHHGQRPSPGTSVRAMRSAPIKLHWCGPGAELPPRQPGRWPGS